MTPETYWTIGGCDEDFVGHYGQTDVHYNKRASRLVTAGKLRIQVHENVVLTELLHGSPCALVSNNTTTCEDAISKWVAPTRDTSHNKKVLAHKLKRDCWSNDFLRFSWTTKGCV